MCHKNKKTGWIINCLFAAVLMVSVGLMPPAYSEVHQGALGLQEKLQVSKVEGQKKLPKILELSPKLQKFLKAIMVAESIDDVRKAFEKEKFSKKELEQLEAQIKNQPYKRKLDNLYRQAEKKAESEQNQQVMQRARERIKQNELRAQQQLEAMNRKMEVRLRSQEKRLSIQEKEFAPVGRLNPPKIASLSSSEITPGQVIDIRGKNFGGLRGKVLFLISGETFEGKLNTWRDESIMVALPQNISGLPPVLGKVEVINTAKMRDNETIKFIPTMEQRHLYASRSLLCWGIIGDAINKVLLSNYQLINEWHVAEVWLEVETEGKAGAYYKNKPSIGAASPRAEVRIWANAFSYVRAVHNVIIQGPRGLRPYVKK